MGMIPNHALANSSAPFADAARLAFGEIAGNGVAICAALGCLGSLAGWTLLVGQSAKAAADDGLFGNVFARTNSKGVPSARLGYCCWYQINTGFGNHVAFCQSAIW